MRRVGAKVCDLIGDYMGDLYAENRCLKQENADLKAELKQAYVGLTDLVIDFAMPGPATLAIEKIRAGLSHD